MNGIFWGGKARPNYQIFQINEIGEKKMFLTERHEIMKTGGKNEESLLTCFFMSYSQNLVNFGNLVI
jgi:hypothetical protein